MFAKKTYRKTRWMERVMSTALPDPKYVAVPYRNDWLSIDGKYAIDAHITGIGWVDVNYIRMDSGNRGQVLQCLTGVGILTLTPTDRALINVVYLKQFDHSESTPHRT